MKSLVIALLLALPAAAQAPGRIVTVTRTVQTFTQLENDLFSAVKRKNAAALKPLLADDFEMRISATPANPIPREDWLNIAVGRYNIQSFEISDMAVRELPGRSRTDVKSAGILAVSFRYTQKADVGGTDRSGDFMIVDMWVQQADGSYKLAARYASDPQNRPMPKAR